MTLWTHSDDKKRRRRKTFNINNPFDFLNNENYENKIIDQCQGVVYQNIIISPIIDKNNGGRIPRILDAPVNITFSCLEERIIENGV